MHTTFSLSTPDRSPAGHPCPAEVSTCGRDQYARTLAARASAKDQVLGRFFIFIVLRRIVLAISLAALSSPALAEIYRDDFNRPDMELRASPHWALAHGAYYGYQARGSRLLSAYAPIVGPGAISADKFVGASHQGQKYQRVTIDIQFPQTAGDGHAPQFSLLLNWQGADLAVNCYWLALRGTEDFSVARIDAEGIETNTSGWLTYENGPLKTNAWYRLTLEKNEHTLTGTIATADGKVVGKAQTDDNDLAPFTGGHPVLLSRYLFAPAQSIELDNFQYELSDLHSIGAAPVGEHQPIVMDGQLTEPFWKHADAANQFRDASPAETDGPDATDLASSPSARVAFDDETIYVGIRCPLGDSQAAAAARALRPDQMFTGHTAEVFLDPLREYHRPAGLNDDPEEMFFNHPGAKIFRFAVNAANGRLAELLGLPWWQIPFDSATHIGDDYWTAELAIPLASLAYFEQGERSALEPGWNPTWGINFAVDGKTWVPPLNSAGYPTSVGEVTGIHAESQPYRWGLLSAIGPRQQGPVPVAFTVTNSTGSARRVRVTATPLPHTDDSPMATFVPPEAVAHQGWQSGTLSVPLLSPGSHTLLMTIEDLTTGRPLVHRPIHVDRVQVGSARWDRSFYIGEDQAKLLIALGPAITDRRTARCDLRAAGNLKVLQSRPVIWDGQPEGCALFNLDTLPQGEYLVTITVEGHEAAPFNTTLRKLARRKGAVQTTDRGVLLRDGKPFFPFGMYYVEHHLDGDFLDEYAAAGFNTFLQEWGDADSFVRQSQKLKRYGLVPIVSLQNTAEIRNVTSADSVYTQRNLIEKRLPVARETIRMMSRQVGDNILAWYTRDEPNELMLDLVRGLHDVAHQADPYHPTMTVIFQPFLFPAYQDATDILGPDIYPTFPTGRLGRVGDAMRKATGDMHGKPIIAVLQSFYPPKEPYRMPNRAELRCMAYSSVISGATGILWFSYDYNGIMAETNPQAWAAIKQLAGEIKQLAPALLADTSNLPDLRLKMKLPASPRAVLYPQDESLVIVAVNDTNQDVGMVEFSLAERQSSTVEVLFEDRAIKPDGSGTWTDRFGPYAVHIYRVGDSR